MGHLMRYYERSLFPSGGSNKVKVGLCPDMRAEVFSADIFWYRVSEKHGQIVGWKRIAHDVFHEGHAVLQVVHAGRHPVPMAKHGQQDLSGNRHSYRSLLHKDPGLGQNVIHVLRLVGVGPPQ